MISVEIISVEIPVELVTSEPLFKVLLQGILSENSVVAPLLNGIFSVCGCKIVKLLGRPNLHSFLCFGFEGAKHVSILYAPGNKRLIRIYLADG